MAIQVTAEGGMVNTRQLAHTCLMHGDCMICMVMSLSGVLIGGLVILVQMVELIPQVVHQANLGLPVEEVGMMVEIIAIMVTHKIAEAQVGVSGGLAGIHGGQHQVIQASFGVSA